MTDFKGKKKGLDIVYIAFSKAVDSLTVCLLARYQLVSGE